MSLKDKWVQEYVTLLEDKDFHKQHDNINIEIDSILKKLDIKYILTTRLKTVVSLKEKIKRKELDQREDNTDKNVKQILDDMIGIRIICMKNEDEKKILTHLITYEELLQQKNFTISESLTLQPKYQKNGHAIYKIKGVYHEYGVEIQIKSLANLFWGEMEHFLIYKNNKYLMNNSYYRKEMDSIHKELEIIDNRLTYMEEVMMSENEESLLDEKKDILKRLLYINVKDKLKDANEGEYLNSNYIYDGIANLIFKEIKIKKKNKDTDSEAEYNKRLSNAMNFILDSSKMAFELSNFEISQIISLHDALDNVDVVLFNTLLDTKNGWWFFIILHSLLKYNNTNSEFIGSDLNSKILKHELIESINEIKKLLKIKLYGDVDEYWRIEEDNESCFIKKLVEEIKCEQIHYFSKNKDLNFTDKKFQHIYKDYVNILVEFISTGRQDIIVTEDQGKSINILAKNIVDILSSLNADGINIKNHIENIDKEFNKIKALTFSFPDKLMNKNKITVKEMIKSINSSKEGK